MRHILFLILIKFCIGYNNPNYINKLARENYKLVGFFSKPYLKKNNLNQYQKDELISEGYLGLMMACRKYDSNYNVAFSTYSSYWIRRYMNIYIKKMYANSNILNIDLNQIGVIDKQNMNMDLDYLTEMEKELIKKRFWEAKKIKDIAELYDVSRDTIRNRIKRILFKIRRIEKL